MQTIRAIFGIDLRTLALFRIGLGLLLILDLIIRASNLTAHYTDNGVLPRAEAISYLSDWSLSIHLINGSTAFQVILFIISGFVAFALLIGYRTRIATIVSWFLLLSLHNRNPILLQGGDNLLLMLLFWAMFLPLGARFSFDAAVNSSTQEAPNKYFSIATMALLIQGMSVYFFSAFLKSGDDWIPDGTAVYYALHAESFATPLAVWFRQFPMPLQALTYFVWYLELIGPLLIFSPIFRVPLRLMAMFLFIAMHSGFVVFLKLGLFPFISIASILAFTPTWVWEKIDAWTRTAERLGVKMYYDRDCGFCKKTCLLIRTFLLLRDTPIIPAQEVKDVHLVMVEHNSWVVVDYDGSEYVRWQAIVLVVRRSAIFWPLAYLFGFGPMKKPGDRIYNAVATNRGLLGNLTAELLPYRPVRTELSLGASALVVILMLIVFYMNVSTLPNFPHQSRGPLEPIIRVLKLDQKWNMFAPNPLKIDGWYVIRGELIDGTIVDVYNRREGEPSWEKPKYVSWTYPNYRWRKYLSRIRRSKYKKQRLNYGRYLCRSWNKDAPAEKKLSTYEIYFYMERTLPDYQERKIESRKIWSHYCFKKSPS